MSLVNKIVFYVTAVTTIYHVLGLCQELNPTQYIIIIDFNKKQTNKLSLNFINNITNKYNVKIYITSFLKIKNNLRKLIYTYKYWFFSKPHDKYDINIINNIQNFNKNIKIIGMQVGIILNTSKLIYFYTKNLDILITWGQYWEKRKLLNDCEILPLGFSKLSLYKNISEEYFIIFTQPYLRFKCNTKEWGYFNYILFFKNIVELIRETYGKNSKICISQHPVSHIENSEPYITDIINKYNLINIKLSDMVEYINNMKIGFTYSSAIALELKAIGKKIIIYNTGKYTTKQFNFKKHNFEVAYDKNQLKKYIKSLNIKLNISHLMNNNASKNIINYLKI